MDLGFAGRVALVVGGGRGIGRAVALSLAREGADVAVLSRTAAELEQTRAELGTPTILVLGAAALYRPQKLQHVDDAEAARSIAVDVQSAISLCKRVLPGMMEARFGRIVGLGSVAARTGVSGGTLYAAGKAALEGLMRGIALDYSRRGITANVCSIAFAETERLQGRIAEDPSHREKLERATATRAIPTAAEIADVVAFLCSARASAITGAVVDATAGAHLNNLW